MSEQSTIVFTDGAAKGNPGPGGWGVVIVAPDGHVTELGGGSPHTTNNRMELSGAIAALDRVAATTTPIAIYTDSSYVINGIKEWIWSWQRRGWKTATGSDVLNRDLWEQLFELVMARGRRTIDWRWVKGHDGTPGNERADEISVAYALKQPAGLYDGPLSGYRIPILDVPAPSDRGPAKPSNRTSKAKAYSYVSVVDGVSATHATWAECEQRVKGRSGARFKKAVSAEDERAILRGWGIPAGKP